MYQIIYDFFYENLFNNLGLNGYHTEIMNVDTTMGVWLSHTATITTLIIFVVIMALVIRWVFRVFSNTLRSF